MARIRSVHPGLFTDEAFVSLSMPARMLLIGIWTEADDHGVFEWKPITLKMKVFPADSVDVAALLKELVAANHIKMTSVSGKNYGIVRNFRKYQRPKSPSYVHPFLPEWGNYIGLKPTEGETQAVELEALPPNGEITPQMEDEGGEEGKEEGLEKKDPPALASAIAAAIAPVVFEKFWEAYPKRDGANPKEPCRKKFSAAVKSGENPDEIIAAAGKYAAEIRTSGQAGTQFVARALTWLNEKRWKDYQALPGDAERQAQMDADMRARGYDWVNGAWAKKTEAA